MKTLTESEIRKIQMDMVSFIDDVCRKNKIEYSLGGGSLLGSIRHKGFIPWDDDIDIMLKRSEYEKLIQVIKTSENLAPFQLLHYTTEKTLVPFAKLYNSKTIVKSLFSNTQPDLGVFVDIFPMDALPEDENERKNFQLACRETGILLESDSFPYYAWGPNLGVFLAKLVLRFPQFLKAKGKWQEIAIALDTEMQKYENHDEKYIGFVPSYYGLKECFENAVFLEYEDVQFEDLTLRKIKNHDAYLSQLYGDYMQLPPENKRVNHDHYKWYWKEGK